MLRTARYIEVNGRRLLGSFDKLNIDPVATHKQALRNVSTRDVKVAHEALEVAEYNRVPFGEYKALKLAYEAARKKYSDAVREYERVNPIHFGPRHNEIVLCPLLFNGKS